MASSSDIRKGLCIHYNNDIYKIIDFLHVKPGKGGAFAQVEMKNLRNGSKLNERFRSADKVEKVRLEQKEQQYLYESDNTLFFMDKTTFEQIELTTDVISDKLPFLEEGMTVQIEYHEQEALNVTLPERVVCKVVNDIF